MHILREHLKTLFFKHRLRTTSDGGNALVDGTLMLQAAFFRLTYIPLRATMADQPQVECGTRVAVYSPMPPRPLESGNEGKKNNTPDIALLSPKASHLPLKRLRIKVLSCTTDGKWHLEAATAISNISKKCLNLLLLSY